VKESSILRVIQDSKICKLFIQTADFYIIYAVLINDSPILFFLLIQSTSNFRHFKY